jgi:hypothetical protein
MAIVTLSDVTHDHCGWFVACWYPASNGRQHPILFTDNSLHSAKHPISHNTWVLYDIDKPLIICRRLNSAFAYQDYNYSCALEAEKEGLEYYQQISQKIFADPLSPSLPFTEEGIQRLQQNLTNSGKVKK